MTMIWQRLLQLLQMVDRRIVQIGTIEHLLGVNTVNGRICGSRESTRPSSHQWFRIDDQFGSGFSSRPTMVFHLVSAS